MVNEIKHVFFPVFFLDHPNINWRNYRQISS